MRRKVKLNNVELNSNLETEINQNIDDILEFCPENSTIDMVVEKGVKNKASFEIKILLKGPSLKIYSSAKSENIIEALHDCKRKVLNQFKRHRNKTVLRRRQMKARHIRDNRFKLVG